MTAVLEYGIKNFVCLFPDLIYEHKTVALFFLAGEIVSRIHHPYYADTFYTDDRFLPIDRETRLRWDPNTTCLPTTPVFSILHESPQCNHERHFLRRRSLRS